MPRRSTTTNAEPSTTNALTVQVSDNRQLSSALMGLEGQLEAAARQNLAAVLETQGTSLQAFTDLEQKALLYAEELRLSNSLDLAGVMLRGKILHEMEELALFSVYPGESFTTLKDLARAMKISISEYSDTRAMYDVIFPWIENTLGMTVAEVWDRVGKTNFRTAVPYLRACIQGEDPDTQSAADNLHRLMDTIAVEMRQNGEEPDDATIRDRVARRLIEAGAEDSTRVFGDRIQAGDVGTQRDPRPEHQPTEPITPTLVMIDGRTYMIAEVTEEQITIAARKLGRHLEAPQVLNLPADRRARQREALRNPVMRAIREAFEG